MRRGTIYRRCTRCGRKVPKKTCEPCGNDRFTWAYTVDVGHVGGKRRQRSKSGFATKSEASTALANVQVSVAKGTYVESSRQTVAEFLADEWLPAIESSIRPTTLRSYAMHVDRHVCPRIGLHRLQQLTGAHINALYSDLLTSGRTDGSGGLSPATVQRIHATLHRALRDAVRWGKLTRNPADQSDPPKASASKAIEMRTWSADELRFFIREVRGDRLYAAWLTAGTTGLRRGELLGLMWNDVDLIEGRLSIRRARVSSGGVVVLSEPKTRRSRRVVALDQTTIAALREHRTRQLEDRLAWGAGWEDTGFVFTREDGTPLHPESLSKMFQWRIRRAGLPRIRFHDLRHTHATLALQAGVHPKVVSERLGHSSIGITLDTYSHAIPAMQEEAAERIASLVFDR